MCNRLVDHEEFSAQRCFYHDVAVPINEKPAIRFRQVRGDFAALFEAGFEVFADFLGENIGSGRLSESSRLSLTDPEDVEASLIAVNAFCVPPR